MPSEFDYLVAELRAGQAVTSLPPDYRREIEARIAEMKTPPQMAKSLSVEPARPVAAREVPVPMHRTAPISTTQLLAAAAEAKVASTKAMLAARSTHRKFVRDRARESAREVLAKALTEFHAGRLTGHQVATIEARSHRIMAMAAQMEGQR